MQAPVAEQLERARMLAQRGQVEAAEALCREVLVHAPGEAEALNYIAMRALSRGDLAEALALLKRAAAAQPDDVATLKNLGVIARNAGDTSTAESALQRAIALAPGQFDLQLHLGQLWQQLGQADRALATFLRAVTAAQAQGYWLSAASTPPPLRKLVTHATSFIRTRRLQAFGGVLEDLRAQHGAAALARLDACLATYLGDVPPAYTDARQRPKFLFFPGLPATPYLPRERFPWQDALESQFGVIRAELEGLLAGQRAMEPFLGVPTPAEGDAYLHGSRGAPSWDAFFFYRHGERHEANCARCPHTAAILDALPLARIREHAPEICFSLLTPGTHILPHHGVTNTRLVTHLPLIVPPDCAIRVGGEEHVWQEGRCVSFDDTYEHEAWNRSDRDRVVLILDCWNPWLTEVEKTGVTDLVGAIGDFNRAFPARG